MSKTFDRKDVFSWANCEDAKEYIGMKGYFAHTLSQLNERIQKADFERLEKIDDSNTNCFCKESDGAMCYWSMFLPVDKVKEIEEPKKYRPFKAIFEFVITLNSRVGKSIRLRAKCSDPFENVFLIDGFTETPKRELKYIFLSGIRYTPEELLKNYEFNKDGHWQPFGVEE